MGKTGWLLISTIAIAVIVLLVWIFRPRRDCAFSGWKQTVGVELSAELDDLKQVQTKVGITDSQVRDFDALLRDYAVKYDAACMDFNNHRMTQDAYQCLRSNMDSVLNDIRRFTTAVEEAKTVSDAATQKRIILSAFDTLKAASASSYRAGCTSALDVNPKRISFAGTVPERSVEITNRGNTDLIFSVDGLPEAFDPKPISGRLARGTSVPVVILRTILPLPVSQPLRFHVRSNMMDDEEVEIELNTQSATVWKDLAKQADSLGVDLMPLGKAPPDQGESATLRARVALESSLGKQSHVSEADRYLLTACVLVSMGEQEAARKALRIAAEKDPSTRDKPSSLILAGVLNAKSGNVTDALASFKVAKSKSGDKDPEASSLSDLFIGSLLAQKGDEKAAAATIRNSKQLDFIQQHPALPNFVDNVICPGKGCTMALVQSAMM